MQTSIGFFLAYGEVTCSCEFGNESSVSIICGEFLDQFRIFKLRKENRICFQFS